MCYSTALRKGKEFIEGKLEQPLQTSFKVSEDFKPYYHLNGFTHQHLQIIKMDDIASSYFASWGLVPDWAKNNPEAFRKKSNTLNARGETIFEKKSYSKSTLDKRCLILADGFFEPNHQNGKPIPHFCYQPSATHPNGDLFMYAGLYNELDDHQYTTTILTIEANDFFAEIHNKKKRMPLVLDANYYLDWLDDSLSAPMVNELIATGFTSQAFKAHPVSRDLYKKGIDTNQPYIVEAVEKGTLF